MPFGKMRFVFAINICMSKSLHEFIQDSKTICEYIKQHGIQAWRTLIG
jgi:trehalose-6-phosphate synthase